MHPGQKITYDFLKKKYWWPFMELDINYYISCCKTCQIAKGNMKQADYEAIMPDEPGQVVEYDFKGPILGILYLLCFSDRYTNWVLIVPVTDACASTVCLNFLKQWVPLQGFPLELISDVGTSNKNALNDMLMNVLGIKQLYASPGRHQASGHIENVIKQINAKYRCLNVSMDNKLINWDNKQESYDKVVALLPGIQAYINGSINTVTSLSPNMLDKGRELRLAPVMDTDKAINEAREKYAQIKEKNGNKDLKGAAETLAILQSHLKMMKQQRDQRELAMILRTKEKFNGSNEKIRFERNEPCLFYLGWCTNRHSANWMARWKVVLFIEYFGPASAIVRDVNRDHEYQVALVMLKKFNSNDKFYSDKNDILLTDERIKSIKREMKKVNFEKNYK